MPEEKNKEAQEAEAKAAQEAAEAKAAEEKAAAEKAAADALAAEDGMSAEDLKAALKKVRDENAKARIKAKELSERAARADELEAEEEKRRLAKMEEVEREKELRIKAEQAAADATARYERMDRINKLSAVGVGSAYADYVDAKMQERKAELGDEFKLEAEAKKFIEENPAFAGAVQAAGVSGGHQRSSTSGGGIPAKLATVTKLIEDGRKHGTLSRDRIATLTFQKQMLASGVDVDLGDQ